MAFVGGQPLNETDWCMDSGASEHMCNNLNLFEQYDEVADRRKVKIGNGAFLKICGVGTIKLDAWNGQEWRKTTKCFIRTRIKDKFIFTWLCTGEEL